MKSIDVKFYLDTRYKKATNFPLKIQLYFKGNRLYIPLNLYFSKEEWGIISDRKDNDKSLRVKMFGKDWQHDLLEIRNGIDGELIKVNNIISEYQQIGSPFTIQDVKKKYDDGDVVITDDTRFRVLTWFKQCLFDKQQKRCAVKTIKIYENALRQLTNFYESQKSHKIENLKFQEVDLIFLSRFADYIENTCGNSPATASQHLRCLRTIFNMAREKNLDIPYPFGKSKYVIKQVKSAKAALTKEEIRQFLCLRGKIRKNQLRNYDYAVISFLMNGANMIDIALLKNKDIDWSNNELKFVRHKTIQTKSTLEPIRVTISETLKEYLSMYASSNQNANAYHFDIFRNEDITEAEKSERVDNTVRAINKTLKSICKQFQIHNGEVHFQMFRHTFATLYAHEGGNPYMLQMAMGHASFQTTENYLKSLPQNSDAIDALKNKYLPLNFLDDGK